MYAFKIITLAVAALGLVSAQRRDVPCRKVTCNVVTSDRRCVQAAGDYLSNIFGPASVSGNQLTFKTKLTVDSSSKSVFCQYDPHQVQINGCHMGEFTPC